MLSPLDLISRANSPLGPALMTATNHGGLADKWFHYHGPIGFNVGLPIGKWVPPNVCIRPGTTSRHPVRRYFRLLGTCRYARITSWSSSCAAIINLVSVVVQGPHISHSPASGRAVLGAWYYFVPQTRWLVDDSPLATLCLKSFHFKFLLCQRGGGVLNSWIKSLGKPLMSKSNRQYA